MKLIGTLVGRRNFAEVEMCVCACVRDVCVCACVRDVCVCMCERAFITMSSIWLNVFQTWKHWASVKDSENSEM